MNRVAKLRASRIAAHHKAKAASPFKEIPRGRYDPALGWIDYDLPGEIRAIDSLRILVARDMQALVFTS